MSVVESANKLVWKNVSFREQNLECIQKEKRFRPLENKKEALLLLRHSNCQLGFQDKPFVRSRVQRQTIGRSEFNLAKE